MDANTVFGLSKLIYTKYNDFAHVFVSGVFFDLIEGDLFVFFAQPFLSSILIVQIYFYFLCFLLGSVFLGLSMIQTKDPKWFFFYT